MHDTNHSSVRHCTPERLTLNDLEPEGFSINAHVSSEGTRKPPTKGDRMLVVVGRLILAGDAMELVVI
jgi:hypothetical protein